MKKLCAFALSVAMLMSLAACGGKDKEAEETPLTTPEVVEATPTPEAGEKTTPEPTPTPTPKPAEDQLNSAMGFRGGMAFIQFRDNSTGTSYSGMIDAKGKLQYYCEGYTISEQDNSNGYMYTRDGNTIYMVTPKGKVNTYELSDNVQLMLYGEGYVVTQKYKSGFDAVEYVYHIYGEDGKEQSTYSSGSDRLYNMYYARDGIFLFMNNHQLEDQNTYGSSVSCADIYCAQSNTWLKDQAVSYTGSGIPDYRSRDGLLMFRGSHRNGSQNTHPGEFAYLDAKGKVEIITVPEEYGTSPAYIGHADGIMLFQGAVDNTRIFFRYDVKAGTWAKYEGKYADKVGSTAVTGEGYVAISLQGADGKTYSMLLDGDMKDLLDAPVLGTPYGVAGDVLYTMDSSTVRTYSKKGKQLGEITNVNNYSNWLEEEILVTSKREFLKNDGTPAFEVNFDSGKLVTLK